MRTDGGNESLPEFRVHMLGRVDTIAIDLEPIDPAFVNVDEAGNDAGIFSGKIIEADEVAILRALAAPVGVTPIVIIDRVVEPGGHFDRLLTLGNNGRVGKGRVLKLCPVGGAGVLIARKSPIDCQAGQPAFTREGIVSLAAI